MIGTLWPRIMLEEPSRLYFPARGPMTTAPVAAHTADATWRAEAPATSVKPRRLSHPYHTQFPAIGIMKPASNMEAAQVIQNRDRSARPLATAPVAVSMAAVMKKKDASTPAPEYGADSPRTPHC